MTTLYTVLVALIVAGVVIDYIVVKICRRGRGAFRYLSASRSYPNAGCQGE